MLECHALMKTELFEQAKILYKKPLFDLLFEAHTIHRQHHVLGNIQKCALLSVKTGGCPEDCAYCPQSIHYETGVKKHTLLSLEDIQTAARSAKTQGAERFCLGAAWRQVPQGKTFDHILDMVKAVKDEGLEVCVTFGMLTEEQAYKLKEAGVYAYNHNLDTSRDFYPNIITTRTYDDRLETLQHVRKAGMTVCCGGIIGMGESNDDRCALLAELASLEPQPESVPINLLIPIEGTPLEKAPPVDSFDLIRTIATARILLPKTKVRLSAGRTSLNQETHALAFFAGANSIFIGDKLLTRDNPGLDEDEMLLAKLGVVHANSTRAATNA